MILLLLKTCYLIKYEVLYLYKPREKGTSHNRKARKMNFVNDFAVPAELLTHRNRRILEVFGEPSGINEWDVPVFQTGEESYAVDFQEKSSRDNKKYRLVLLYNKSDLGWVCTDTVDEVKSVQASHGLI